MSIIQKCASEKGKATLGFEEYIYTLERKTDVKSIFRCQNRDCKGKFKYDNNIYLFLAPDWVVAIQIQRWMLYLSGPTEHYHTPNLDRAPVVDLKNKMKARAAESEEPSSTMLHSVMRSFPLDSTGQLYKSQTLL